MRIAEFSRAWEGRTIASFPLRQFLGSGEGSAVFLTDSDSGPAAIKLILAETKNSDAQLSRWKEAAKLSHPNLVRIFSSGTDELDGVPLLYVVTELAEENLSQVLPDRCLTAAETREMLEPTLSALAYIHQQGFVHSHLKPANIMAVNDCLKISSDSLRRPQPSGGESAAGPYDAPERSTGSILPAGDVWSLGMTLVEVLTQRLPVNLPPDVPEPFTQIARQCLQLEAADRWTIQQISHHLKPTPATAPPKRRPFAPVGALILLALVAITVVGVIVRSSNSPAPPPATATQATSQPAPAQVTPEPPPPAPAPKQEPKKETVVAKAPEPEPKDPVAATPEPVNEAPTAGVIDQPMPEVIDQARNTIHGKVKVTVRVEVDPSGAVREAKLDSPGSNKYFGERAVAAARQWKFQPMTVNGSEVGQRWRLNFEFLRTGTKVQPQRISP